MIAIAKNSSQMRRLIRKKWNQINWRVNNQDSYIRKGITNDFNSFDEFSRHCISSGLRHGLHSHRPDNNKPYSVDNLEFITPDEHKKKTRAERRKLTDNEVRCIRDMLLANVSQRKIATQFKVSQTLIWKISNGRAYRDVFG